MEAKKKKFNALVRIQLASAITWAAVMLMCSYLLMGTRGYELISLTLICGATIHFLLLSKLAVVNISEQSSDSSPNPVN